MITEAIIFLSYILICAALFKRRFSRGVTFAAFGAAAVVIAGVQAALFISGEAMLALTLLPLTAYLPFSVLLYFLSEGGVFETSAVCSVGMLAVLILKSIDKILTRCFAASEISGYVWSAAACLIIGAMAAGLVFAAFRFVGRPFKACVIEQTRNRLLILLPVLLIFLLTFYFLNSTTDIIVLFIIMCIALSVFFIIAKLLISAAELIRVSRSEKELAEFMEIQRRGYERLIRKVEAGREYRHDMRHHIAIIEGLAKQGECERITEYTGKLIGSLGELEYVSCCKSPEINAVLSEYISRAESVGCKVTHSIALPEKLPFDDGDVCIVLANSIENATNACAKLPEEQRYINISAECADTHKLFVSVKNPCAEPVEIGDDGLPVIDKSSEEHGIGLRSVKRIAEKYNGFLRCRSENGEFVAQTALFSAMYADGSKTENGRRGSLSGRAAASLLGLGAGVVLMLNAMPAIADAASSVLSVNIHTIRELRLGWGDNSLNEEYPEFEGNGADEINSAVTDYIGKARERFMWYFNRRYNGYAAEDTRYTVIRDDERYLVVQFSTTVNAGGSAEYNRWIVCDKSADKVLELADLFKEGSDYLGVISAEILSQMRFQNEHEGACYFIDSADEACFTRISEDANFYIDSFDRPVIVFDEYEVAPGFMGCPEFIIPKKVLEEIAR